MILISAMARSVPVMAGIPYTYCGGAFEDSFFAMGGADGVIHIVSENEICEKSVN